MIALRDVQVARQRLRDGTELVADIWRPAAPGRYPVLLMRQPYGRRIASTLVYAHPAAYAQRGYIVVIQDVRGTGDSFGHFRLFENEAEDGRQAVAWAAGLAGSSGLVGMYGFSYQGTTQLLALGAGAELAAIAPAMPGWTIRNDWAWENGAWPLALNVGWAAQMAALQARRAGDAAAFSALREAGSAIGIARPARPEILERYQDWSHYADWIDHPEPGSYWEAIAPALPARSVPALHVGGWSDFLLEGTLGASAAIGGGLIVGPWTHAPWGRHAGTIDVGANAAICVDRLQLAFFDQHLKGIAGAGAAAHVRLYDVLKQDWRDFDRFPAPRPLRLHLRSTGLAATEPGDGKLEEARPAVGQDVIVHDPFRPAPALGGHAAPLGGMRDRLAHDERADIATYTWSPPDMAAVVLAGPVCVILHVETDAASFDIHATLAVVGAFGTDKIERAWNLTEGHATVSAGSARPLRLAMRAMCATISAGSSLRLSIAGACWPAYPVNPGTGTPPTEASALEQRPITIAILHGESALELPVNE